MMKKKVEFLDRLFKVLECRSNILEFLKQEKLITDDEMQNLLHEHHNNHSTKIAMLLNNLQASDSLQLVDYEWTILPSELLRLTIVSPNAKEEFLYSV